MYKIEQKYLESKNKSTDINEHLETLLEYGKKCEHITEMGVRWVSSTWPLLLSSPKKMISYDIKKLKDIDEVLTLCSEYNIDYQFIEDDVLVCEIENTDLLFIDTLHTYNQLTMELDKHSENVKKYIILHDTESFGRIDEILYPHVSFIIKNKEKNKCGLMTAVEDFLISEKGKNWKILTHYKNNNGLTILERI